MHIHTPKALSGWREVAGEIAIIVVGIIIALALEAAVDAMRWRRAVEDGRSRLRAEMQADARVYAHRYAVRNCVAARLAVSRAVIEARRAGRAAPAIMAFPAPGNGPVLHDVWTALQAAQVLVHFPPEELRRYSRFYTGVTDAEYFMDRESRAWERLRLIEGNPAALSAADISELRVAQNEAEGSSVPLASVAGDQLGTLRELGVPVPADDYGRAECAPVARG